MFWSRPWYQPERLVSAQARRARADTIRGLISGTRSKQQCDVAYIIYLKSKTSIQIQIPNKEYNVLWRSYRFFFRIYKTCSFLFIFICVKTVRVVGLCWQTIVIWNTEEGSLSSEMKHYLLEFKIIERETSLLRSFVMSHILSLWFRKFPVRFHS